MANTEYWNQLTPEQQERLNDLRQQFNARLFHEVDLLVEAIEHGFPGWTLASTNLISIDLAPKPTTPTDPARNEEA